MKKSAWLLLLFFLGMSAYLFFSKTSPPSLQKTDISPSAKTQTLSTTQEQEIPRSTVIVEGLDTPWAIAFLPDQTMLIAERRGTVLMSKNNGNRMADHIATIPEVREIGEGGLMGIAIHPEFVQNKFVYLYYTYAGSDNNTLNRIVRMTLIDNKLVAANTIIDNIPAAANHNGGRIHFGPDRQLYITTGDAQEPSLAQDTRSLAGKILRVTDEGKPSSGNPFNNLVYSYGHRNPQGIAWDKKDNLWSTEHGPSGFETGNDEVNNIISGGNYGWPLIRGIQKRDGMMAPVIESGKNTTWAPGGMAILQNKIFFAGLRGQALYEYDLRSKTLREHFKNEFGRMRDVVVGSDGMLYITTSNRDGRGSPKKGDDKVIRANPRKL